LLPSYPFSRYDDQNYDLPILLDSESLEKSLNYYFLADILAESLADGNLPIPSSPPIQFLGKFNLLFIPLSVFSGRFGAK